MIHFLQQKLQNLQTKMRKALMDKTALSSLKKWMMNQRPLVKKCLTVSPKLQYHESGECRTALNTSSHVAGYVFKPSFLITYVISSGFPY